MPGKQGYSLISTTVRQPERRERRANGNGSFGDAVYFRLIKSVLSVIVGFTLRRRDHGGAGSMNNQPLSTSR